MNSPTILRSELRPGIFMLALSLLCMGLLRWADASLLPLVGIIAAALVVCIIRAPHLGFAALPPLLLATSYPPAFDDPGTLLFIVLSGVWVIAELWQSRNAVRPGLPSWLWKLMLFASALLIVNFATAIHHGIPVSAWVRGAYPFLLFGLATPFVLRKYPESSWILLTFSLGIVCFIFSLEILYVYVANKLWQEVPTSSHFFHEFLRSKEGKYFSSLYDFSAYTSIKFRVTYILPEASGLFPALGLVGWALAAHQKLKRYQWIATIAAATCFCAVITTTTRSMIFCCALSIGLTLLLYYWNNRKRFLESALIGTTIIILSLPFLLSTDALTDLWQRNLVLIQNTIPNTIPNSESTRDVGYRAQEYQQAWKGFIQAPLTGQGFGHTITLVFPIDNTGAIATLHPAYVHNWFFYWLMVAGIPGLLVYGFLTLAPLVKLRGFRGTSHLPMTLILAGSAILIASYGLFFAVYRTLPSVFCLAMLLGWTLSNDSTKTLQKSDR